MDTRIKWNFQKYMINPDGTLHGYAAPGDKPFSEEIIEWIDDKMIK